MLLQLGQIKRRLDEKFLTLEPAITGFRLVEVSKPFQWIGRCELLLAARFPPKFKELVLRFDFGSLTIGPTAFCNLGDYSRCLLRWNEQSSHPWWGQGTRPEGLLMIANSEFVAILLDLNNDRVLAFPHGKPWENAIKVVARDFEFFMRGIGTIFVERVDSSDRNRLAGDVAAAVGGIEGLAFWTELAR